MDLQASSSPHDLYRHYVEKALHGLAPHVSQQTGFLHLHPDIYRGLSVQAAFVEDNVAYALLLLRRKTVESIQEGKGLLNRLLSFQNFDKESEQYGNFPTLLTDYPACKNWRLPISLSVFFFTILTKFGSVLGEELRQKLSQSHKILLRCAVHNSNLCRYADWERFIVEEGKVLDELPIVNPRILGLLLAVCPDDLNLFQKVSLMWSREATTYAGPPVDVEQFGREPAVTLFDVAMSCLLAEPLHQKEWPYRALLDVGLITPRDIPIKISESFLSIRSSGYFVERFSSIVFAGWLDPFRQGLLPLRIVTPSFTAAVYFPSATLVSYVRNERGCTCQIQVSEGPDPSVVRIYVERKGSVRCSVGGVSVTLFNPSEGFDISDGPLKLHIHTEAQGVSLIGQIGVGNRIHQLAALDAGEYSAYDWKISVDRLRGGGETDIQVRFDFEGI